MSLALSTKAEFRQHARQVRDCLPDRDQRSARINRQLQTLPMLAQGQTLCTYLAVRSEVGTQMSLPLLLARFRRVAIPYCAGSELELFQLHDLSELVLGRFGILEPSANDRQLPERRVLPAHVEVALVPGLAFDRRGQRLGYGRGYYDRLLKQLPENCWRIGLAFSCQVFEQVPVEPHDVPLHLVVTENEVIATPVDGPTRLAPHSDRLS